MEPAEIGIYSVDRTSLKGDAIQVYSLYTPTLRPFSCGNSWQIGTELPAAHTALAATFLLHLASVGKYSLKQFGKYSRWQRVFLGSKSKPYMTLVNIRTKFRFFSFDFCQNFDVTTFSW